MSGLLRRPSANIYKVITSGDNAELKRILKGINPAKLGSARHGHLFAQMMDMENLTPMQHACAVGSLETVRLMVEAGANVNAPMRGYIWGNPLWYAINRRRDPERFRIAKYLIDVGADCTDTEKTLTDMMILLPKEKENETICRDQFELFRCIYEAQKAKSAVPMTEAQSSLLVQASSSCANSILQFLVEEGYPINPAIDAESGHSKDQIPLCRAAGSGNVQAVEFLLAHGADVLLRDINNMTPLETVLDKREQVLTKDWLKFERERIGDYDRVIEILKAAE